MDQSFSFGAEQVRRSAAGMIEAYGHEAGRICEAQIAKMCRRKDAAGEQVWRDVLAQIRICAAIQPV
jgi:hypothetical protein